MATTGYQPSDRMKDLDTSELTFGIVVAEWNKHITTSLLEGCQAILKEHKLTVEDDDLIWVPGSFELPMGAKLLASSKKYDAIICLGCIIKGETEHDRYIAQSVANGLTQLGLISNIPILFGVLTTNDENQALARAGGSHGNKGAEAALSALQMAALKRSKSEPSKSIGYR